MSILKPKDASEILNVSQKTLQRWDKDGTLIAYRNPTYKDRFVRFGFDWFESFCNKFGTNIVVLNNKNSSPEEELVEDLISIIHVFSCRIYGLRKYQSKIKGDFNVKDI